MERKPMSSALPETLPIGFGHGGTYVPDYKPHVDSLLQINAELRRSNEALVVDRDRILADLKDAKERAVAVTRENESLKAEAEGHSKVLAEKEEAKRKAVEAVRKIHEDREARARSTLAEAESKLALIGNLREIRAAAAQIVELTKGLPE